MSKLCIWLMLVVLLVAATGCKSTPRGDLEFIPGKGWVPVN